ncbi:hypothetical protein RB195_002500 [Necator americanus]|uniref:Uncharacterized protein n=1 Tax=Necator americanus TaxID=51031 RepID=A0ABR1DJH7_NECAM
MHLQRIDSLEARLREEQEERSKANSALAAYMSRCHKLEKKIQEANIPLDNASFKAGSKEEVLAMVGNLRDLLRHLGTENKELRKECRRLLNGHGLLSVNSTDRSLSNETLGDASTENCLKTDDRLDEKQQGLLRDLEAFISNTGGNQSLLEAMKDLKKDMIHVTDADFASSTSECPDRSNIRAAPRDSIAPGNLSAVNVSLMELMNLSLNTSKDIANFRERLGSFRGMMERIFETLRNSGLLLEEVLEKFGSETDEDKMLVEKIRGMKFAWNTCLNQTNQIMDAIHETEQSMNDAEMKLIALEKSINEVSFCMDFSVVHTSTRCFTQLDAQAHYQGGDVARCEHNEEDFLARINSHEEKVTNLRLLLEKAENDRDCALSSLETLGTKMKDAEAKIAQLSKEREKLIAAARTESSEKESLRASLKEQQLLSQHLKESQSDLHKNAEALLQEVAEKNAVLIDMERRLVASKKLQEKLEAVIREREEDISKLHEASENERKMKSVENNDLKADLAAEKQVSQLLRRDIEKISSELNRKESTIRQLRDQLQVAAENNARMVEVLSELQQTSTDKENESRKDSRDSVTVVEVQALPSVKVKTREAQTDLTRTVLAQMELDSVSYSSELKALRNAYVELATAISELVVKDIDSLPCIGDIPSIEKSCKELSKLIRHEKRRREQQATQIAEIKEKISDPSRKGVLGATALKDVSRDASSDQPKTSKVEKKYENPMRQTLYVLTTMARDLVIELRYLASNNASGHKMNFTKVIDDARKLRNELNDRLIIVRSDKENMNNCDLSELLYMLELRDRDNRTLFESLNRCKAEYEALEKKNANNPDLAKKIGAQLRNIHAAMDASNRACALLQEHSKKTTNRPRHDGSS